MERLLVWIIHSLKSFFNPSAKCPECRCGNLWVGDSKEVNGKMVFAMKCLSCEHSWYQ